MNARERFKGACYCEPVDRTPIWIMRQAGRYLPEYRKLKEKYSFLELVKNPELAARVTMQPLRRFELDAAIVFSDILVIPEALGQPYQFKEKGGIAMDFRIESPADIDHLDPGEVGMKLGYVGKALQLTREELGGETALLGFGGSPWTLATYMVEGGSSTTFERIKALFFKDRTQFERLLEKITGALLEYFKMQIKSGVDALQIFDSWAGLCPDDHYEAMSLGWVKRIIEALPETVPVILFAKGMAHHAAAMAATGARVLSLDWTVNLASLREEVPREIALQGNLDPALLDYDVVSLRRKTREILEGMRNHNGHIFNLGHGIRPTAKIENVRVLIETVQNFRKDS